MHMLTTHRADSHADSLASGDDPRDTDTDTDTVHESRMAWIASLWATLAVLATGIALWDSWHTGA